MTDPVVVPQDGVAEGDRLQRLWTPHRMAYIASEARTDTAEGGCPFDRIPTLDDRDGLIVTRAKLTYAVLNLYPYNPGHLMVVPYRHVAELEDLTEAEANELMAVTQQAVRAIRAASRPQGFNVGINLGGVAARVAVGAPASARRAAVGRRLQLHPGARRTPRSFRSCCPTRATCSRGSGRQAERATTRPYPAPLGLYVWWCGVRPAGRGHSQPAAVILAARLLGIGSYRRNVRVNVPAPWVSERRSIA